MSETPYRRFQKHRVQSKHRGIKFLFTFEEWLNIWTDSGQFHNAGKHRGQYHMARYGDKGPYAVGNVRIVPCEVNHSEMRHSMETRAKMTQDRLGRKHTEATKEKIRLAQQGPKNPNYGKKLSAEVRAKMSKGKLGNKNSLGHKQTAEHKANVREGMRRARLARQEQHV